MKKITLKSVFLLCFSVLYSVSAFSYDATYTINGVADDIPNNTFKGINGALAAVKLDPTINSVLLNVVSGRVFQKSWDPSIERPLVVTVQGAGADQTTMYAYTETTYPIIGAAGTRLIDFTNIKNEGMDITFKDMSFEYYGLGHNVSSGFIQMNVIANVKATFINCNIRYCEARLGAILRMDKSDRIEAIFDNCSFTNITSFRYAGGLGAPFHVGGGKLTIKNCRFYGNSQDGREMNAASTNPLPGVEIDLKIGSFVSVKPTAGNVEVTLENNIVVNNLRVAQDSAFIQPIVSVEGFAGSANTATLNMTNNIIIGNSRSGKVNDVSLYYQDTATVIINGVSGNIANAVRKGIWNAETNTYNYSAVRNLELQGFKIDATYSYTDPRINFTMDDQTGLPLITPDNKKVNNMTYSGNGGAPADPSGLNSLSLLNFEIYPNPSKGQFKLTLQNITKHSSYEILSISGTMITSDKFSGNSVVIDLGNTPKGMYLIKVKNDNSTTTRKIILD